jgi:uncharacterized protein YyaL (SSP411 family)
VLGEPRYLAAARRAATYVLDTCATPDGRLLATARGGRANLNAYLDDYAFLIQGLLDLYEADFDPHGSRRRSRSSRSCTSTTSRTRERRRVLHDLRRPRAADRAPQVAAGRRAAVGQRVQVLNLLRLAELTGRGALAQRAETAIRSAGAMINRYPQAFSQMLAAVDFIAAGPREIVIAGELSDARVRALIAAVRGRFQPQRTVALADSRADTALMPILDGKSATADGPRAFVCRNYACRAPVTTPEALLHELVD